MPDDRFHVLILYIFASIAGPSFLLRYTMLREHTDERSPRPHERDGNHRDWLPYAVAAACAVAIVTGLWLYGFWFGG